MQQEEHAPKEHSPQGISAYSDIPPPEKAPEEYLSAETICLQGLFAPECNISPSY